LFFIGWIIDIFVILGKPNPYYVWFSHMFRGIRLV